MKRKTRAGKQSHNRRKHKAGLPPGTLVHIGEKRTSSLTIDLISYGDKHFEKAESLPVSGIDPYLEKDNSKTWIRIAGVHDPDKISDLGGRFGIHPLVLEDIVNTTQRPKIEAYDDYLYVVVKSIAAPEDLSGIDVRQTSLVLSRDCLLSFHEQHEKQFDMIPPRIDIPGGRFRRFGTDYLLYALMDIIVDNYFSVVEAINDGILKIEEAILNNEIGTEKYDRLHQLRAYIIKVRGLIIPLREVLQSIIRDEHSLISDETGIYFRDILDHLKVLTDEVKHSEEIALVISDMYMTRLNMKTGETMRVLTIIATIFIPLTFIAGIYGMNFDPDISPFNMPELGWYFGYPAVMLFMLSASIGMLIYFRKKRWI